MFKLISISERRTPNGHFTQHNPIRKSILYTSTQTAFMGNIQDQLLEARGIERCTRRTRALYPLELAGAIALLSTAILSTLGVMLLDYRDNRLTHALNLEFEALNTFFQKAPSLEAYQLYRSFVEKHARSFRVVLNDDYRKIRKEPRLPGVIRELHTWYTTYTGRDRTLFEDVLRGYKGFPTPHKEYYTPRCVGRSEFKIRELLFDNFPLVLLQELPKAKSQRVFDINATVNGFSLLHLLVMFDENPLTLLAAQALLFEGANAKQKVRGNASDPFSIRLKQDKGPVTASRIRFYSSIYGNNAVAVNPPKLKEGWFAYRPCKGDSFEQFEGYTSQLGNTVTTTTYYSIKEYAIFDFRGMTAFQIAKKLDRPQFTALLRPHST